MTKDVISLSISVLLLFRHYISHKITFGAPSSGGVLCSACGAFIKLSIHIEFRKINYDQIILISSDNIRIDRKCECGIEKNLSQRSPICITRPTWCRG